MMPFAVDDAFAASVATRTGRLLLALRARCAGLPAEQLARQGDLAAHQYLVAELARQQPDDAVLSEEAADDPQRLSADRVWIVDPLDGSREYGEGRRDWAVHVALFEASGIRAGAVALPARDMTWSTCSPFEAVRPVAPRRPIVVVSRTRPAAEAALVVHTVGGELLPMGSAGAKAMAVVFGEADVYVHSGGQHEWDLAAPTAVATAADCHVSRLDGSPLQFNQAHPWLPDVLICRRDLASPILAALEDARRAGGS
jgi:3'(2'), 5'-bisphosphate nucleotidase